MVIPPNFLMWKLCGNCAFSQNFHTRKLGEISVFYAMFDISKCSDKKYSKFSDKFCKIHKKTSVPESHIKSRSCMIKEALLQGFFCEFC